MLPASFTVLDEFPRLPNGKVDVAALSVTQVKAVPARQRQAAVRETERTLMDIWCKVLQADYIDVEDNFFEMGGDSILSIQVVSLAHQAGLALATTDLFDHPTIAQLAAQLRIQKTRAGHSSVSYPDSGQAPLTPIQHWFINQALASPGHWNQNLLLEIEAGLSAGMLEAAIDAVTRRHDALRTCFLRDGDRCYQQVAAQTGPDFSVINVLADDDIDAVISNHASAIQSGFSLERAPLVSFMLFDSSGVRPGRLLICAHHLVIDAVSWRILVEDLEQACRLAIRNETIVLSARSTYSDWILKRLEDPVLRDSEASFGPNRLYSIILEQGRTIMITYGGLLLTNMKILSL